MYHEAAVLNLLELVMFHRTAVESLDNYIFELIDYCYRKLIALLHKFYNFLNEKFIFSSKNNKDSKK